MKRLSVLFSGFGLLVCSSLFAQPEPDKKLHPVEKNLSAEQKRLLHDYVDLQVRQQARYFDPIGGVPIRTLPEIRADVLGRMGQMTPEDAKVFWRDLPQTLRRGFRELDLLHVSAEERKAADALPAAVKEEVAKLLSDDLDLVLAARRKVLAYGPACRALVADQNSRLANDSNKRLRHEDMLAKLDSEESHERIMRIAEPALQRASKLDKARKKADSTIAVLLARRLCDQGNRNDPYGKLCYYNFIHNNHEYTAGVALCFGNGQGNPLGVNFYGGQDNRLTSLGLVKYDDVKKAPGPETTAKWWKDRNGPPLTAIVGHVYLLHLMDPRDAIDFTVKFQVLDRSPDEWIIIEWERIPQEK